MKHYMRTPSYRFTADVNSAADMLRIQELRDTIKVNNRKLKASGAKERHTVKLQGRLGKNNPAAQKYRDVYAGIGAWYAGAHPYQTIRLEDAQYIDVYVHTR